jgi:multiple sugar transport system permease protein
MISIAINRLQQKISQSWSLIKSHRLYHQSKKISVKTFLYILLVDGAFIFLLPVLYMLLLSFFTAEDLLDPSIRWIPVHLLWENYRTAFMMISYPSSIISTVLLTTIAVIGQTIFCGLPVMHWPD